MSVVCCPPFLSLTNSQEFWNWFDPTAWYPLGRVVGGTVYPGLMVTSGVIYNLLHAVNLPVDIRNVCVLLAPAFSALTAWATYMSAFSHHPCFSYSFCLLQVYKRNERLQRRSPCSSIHRYRTRIHLPFRCWILRQRSHRYFPPHVHLLRLDQGPQARKCSLRYRRRRILLLHGRCLGYVFNTSLHTVFNPAQVVMHSSQT